MGIGSEVDQEFIFTLVVLVATAGVLLVVWYFLPILVVRSSAEYLDSSAARKREAVREIRRTLEKVVAGGGIALGALFTFLQWKATREDLAKSTRAKRIASNETRGIALLATDDPMSRTAGVALLRRVEAEDPDSRAYLTQTLAALVRKHAALVREGTASGGREALPEDIQSAFRLMVDPQFRMDLLNEKLYLDDLDLQKLRAPYGRLDGMSLKGARLPYGDLYCATLFNAELYGANLRSANLAGIDGRRMWLVENGHGRPRAELGGAKLFGASLEGSDFTGASFVADGDRAHLDGANCSIIDEGTAKEKRTIFDRADLRGASAIGANFRGATFHQAQIGDLDVECADFEAADLSQAIGTPQHLELAFFCDTKVPPTFSVSDDCVRPGNEPSPKRQRCAEKLGRPEHSNCPR